jgi:hypothetical protein
VDIVFQENEFCGHSKDVGLDQTVLGVSITEILQPNKKSKSSNDTNYFKYGRRSMKQILRDKIEFGGVETSSNIFY